MSPYKQTREQLSDLLPYGLVATKKWLMAQGLAKHSIDNLVKSAQIQAIATGAYKRPDTVLNWQGLVCSIQRMGFDCTVGGLSALELNGLGHYLPMGAQVQVHLYCHDKAPTWLNKALPNVTFIFHRAFSLTSNKSMINTMAWGDKQLPLVFSAPELACLEVLRDVPKAMSFEHADQLMQGLTTLSPRRLHKLLEQVHHVQVKRLFFWFAQRHGHAWAARLDPNDFELGRGKRLVAKGGMLDKQFQITIPKTMAGGLAHG
jgi:hypothetical protein